MIKIEVPIAKDIRKFKTKDIGNFSIKECAFIAAAAAVGIIAYKVWDFALDSCFLCAVPILIIGFLKPFGMSFGEFLFIVLREEFLSPRSYINETDFEYDADELEKITGEPVLIPSQWGEKDATPEYRHTKETLKEMIR